MSRKSTTTSTMREDSVMPQAGDDSGIDLTADIVNIDELQNHGINVSDIAKLKSAGIHSISVLLLIFYFFQNAKLTGGQ